MKDPNILFLDIETSPIVGQVWGRYDQTLLDVIEQAQILCVGFAWGTEDPASVISQVDFANYRPGRLNDKGVVLAAWKLLDRADIVVAHNGDEFDLKKLNARFAFYNLGAPSYYKSIDTKKVSKKTFRFDSNALDHLVQYLGIGRKAETGGFQLWARCIAGDERAWEKMIEYNAHDVELLQKVYLRLRNFMPDHPNLNLLTDGVDLEVCPVCLSHDIHKRGFSTTRTGKRQRYQCGACGSWSSGPLKTVHGIIR